MKDKASRKRTTTRTRGSKATIKSSVDQWITKSNREWGDVMWSPKRGNWAVTRDLVYSHPVTTSLLPQLSPSSLVYTLTLGCYSLAASYGRIGPWWRKDWVPEFSTSALQGPIRDWLAWPGDLHSYRTSLAALDRCGSEECSAP